jgi:branched-chain amino acid transport system ATP-binding protein
VSFLQVKSITKRFGGLVAVNDLSFEVQEQEILSLIGPNGAGKTTTFNMITNFISPDTGSVEFDGRNVTGQEPHSIAKLGMIRTFQKTHIFPLVTVQDNIKMGCHKITSCTMVDIIFHSKKFRQEEKKVDQKVLQMLEFFQMMDIKEYLAKNLSYGQKRILEIAIAMACEPKLLMLDEPVAGLNPMESQSVMQMISKIRGQGVTILLVEHDMNVVMNISDRVVVINFGKKIAEGTPAQVSHNEEVIKAYLGGSSVAKG